MPKTANPDLNISPLTRQVFGDFERRTFDIRRLTIVLIGLALVAILAACSTTSQPATPPPGPAASATIPPSPTTMPSPSPTASPTTVPTASPTTVPTATPTATPSPTAKPSPAATRTPRPTRTPKLEPTLTPLPEPFRRVGPVSDILPGDEARLHMACDGALWLATDQGAARLDGDAWTVQLTEPTGKIAGVDGDGRIWVISEDYAEISSWDGASWEVYNAEAGWAPVTDFWYQDYVDWGQCDRAGRFWLATTQDIRVFDGERWTVFTSQDLGMGEVPDPEGCAPSFQISILKSTGDVWIGECDWAEGTCGGQGARRFDGLAWHGTDSPASQGCVAAIQEDSAGNVWLGVDNALWRYAPTSGEWTRFAPPEEAPFGYRSHGAILALAADPFDRLWVTELLCGPASCDAHALYHVRDGVWTFLPAGEEPTYVLNLRAVLNAAGTTWLFGDIVYRLTETGITPAAYLMPMSAAVDTTGRIWFVDLPGMLCTIDADM